MFVREVGCFTLLVAVTSSWRPPAPQARGAGRSFPSVPREDVARRLACGDRQSTAAVADQKIYWAKVCHSLYTVAWV